MVELEELNVIAGIKHIVSAENFFVMGEIPEDTLVLGYWNLWGSA